jgi:hypothetical protein
MNQPLLIVVALLTITFAGCGKKPQLAPTAQAAGPADQNSAAEPAAAQESANVQSAAQPAASAPDPSNVSTINGVVDPRLTTQLRIFIQEKGRMPESFAEFAGARLDSVPRLAPGLRFAIDPTTQEVKITTK